MAAVTPASFPTTGGVDAVRDIYTNTSLAVNAAQLTAGTRSDRLSLIPRLYYFADLSDGDTWASGLTGIRAIFTSGDQPDTDKASAGWTAAGVVTFDTHNANWNGWVLVFLDPATSGQSIGGRAL